MTEEHRIAPHGLHRALIVRLGHIGDVLLATPVAAALRASFPGARIGWVVEPHSAPLLRGNPHIDEVIAWDRRHRRRMALRPLLELRRRRYDVAIDLHGLTKSAIVGWLAGARVRIGWAERKEVSRLFYNRLAGRGAGGHILDDYLSAVRLLGAETKDRRPTLVLADDDRSWADRFLREHGLRGSDRFVAISPLTTRAAKQWGNDRFAALGDIIQRDLELPVILLGTAWDASILSAEVASAMKPPPISAVGRTTLGQLAAMLERAATLVTVDSGPMHIAATVGTPVVALFGPTQPQRSGPIGTGHRPLTSPVPCTRCDLRRCRLAGGAPWGQCLRGLSPEAVADAVRQVLERD